MNKLCEIYRSQGFIIVGIDLQFELNMKIEINLVYEKNKRYKRFFL